MQVLSSAIKILYKNTTYISGCGGLFPYGDPPETTYKVAGAIYTLLDAIDKWLALFIDYLKLFKKQNDITYQNDVMIEILRSPLRPLARTLCFHISIPRSIFP